MLFQSSTGDVDVKIFTTAFRMVDEVDFSQVPAGVARLPLALEDKWGTPLANGLYYLTVEGSGQRHILKLLILR